VKRIFVVPYVIVAWVVGAGVLLVGIVVFGPYTHSNLQPQVESSYTRTNQVTVGPPDLFGGLPGVALSSDQATRGQALFVTNTCATCHGLRGQGSTIGPTLTGTSAADLRNKTAAGPGGMPAFDPATLSDDDLAAIAAFLAVTH
jgi:ubiquinol-cytochrome c reductase cytochrome c subunit